MLISLSNPLISTEKIPCFTVGFVGSPSYGKVAKARCGASVFCWVSHPKGSPLQRGYMGVSYNSGTPKWMVKIMENPIKMDDLGVPLFLETPIYDMIYPIDIYIYI